MLPKDLFHKKKQDKPDDGVVILKKTEPGMCGGTDASQDTKAPKEILSEDMILFDVTSALSRGYIPSEGKRNSVEKLGYVSAFAAPVSNGTFLFFEKGDSFQKRAQKTRSWAYVKEDVFPSLVRFVRDRDIAKSNGFHSTTHGLPENFGGSVDIRYASGEKISFSHNQQSIITLAAGAEIANLFTKAMNGEKVELPVVSSLKEIRFEELRKNGGFTKAVLTIQPDGTGINAKQSKYDDPKIYESEKPIDAETVVAIKKNIEDTGILAWSDLPSNGFSYRIDKQLTFVFDDGREIIVKNDRLVPDQIGRGFFNIELEMTTKH